MKNKTQVFICLLLLLCCIFTFVACNNGSGGSQNNGGNGSGDEGGSGSGGGTTSDVTKYTVTLNANGGTCSQQSLQLASGEKMSALPTPTRTGYRFVGWFDTLDIEYTTESKMPSNNLVLKAEWEKIVSKYEDEYVSLKPAARGTKSDLLEIMYGKDVDEFVYVEITSDDLGGKSAVGETNNFNFKTIDALEYKVKSGYSWLWYQGDFNTPNGTQRFTLGYGSNIQFVTVSDGSGVVVKTYLVDIYVLHDYNVNVYQNVFATEPYDTIRVIENERLSPDDIKPLESAFQLDARVYYDNTSRKYVTFAYSTAIKKDWDLYCTFKDETLTANLDGGTLEGQLVATPYTQNFTLPSPAKDGYDFLGWQLPNGKYITNVQGYSGTNYLSDENNGVLKAIWQPKTFYYTNDNETLQTTETIPVVTYTDSSMTEILQVINVVKGTDCVAPTQLPKADGQAFTNWQTYNLYNDGSFGQYLSSYDFDEKITAPLALAPAYGSSTGNSLIYLNETNTYSQTGTYKMYLPTRQTYSLKISTSGSVSFSITQGSKSAQSYTLRSGSLGTYAVGCYTYNLGSYVLARGYVTLSVTSLSGTFTATLTGAIAEVSSEAIPLTSSNSCQVGQSFSVTAQKAGYTFDGWYDGATLVQQSNPATFQMPIDGLNYTAKWTLRAEMSNFVFTSTPTTLQITGLRDCNVTEIVVPSYVTSIRPGAFSGCGNLQEITLPFVGDNAWDTTPSASTLFGHIFGTSSYTGGMNTSQRYPSYNSTVDATLYYIPSNLRKVTITGGNILFGAFYNCSELTEVVISEGVTSIGDSAFHNCSSLASITIPNSVTSIGNYAFQYCSSLTIYCEAASAPSGWGSKWNCSDCPVVWNCNNNAVLIDGLRYALNGGNATVAIQPKNTSGAITIPQTVMYNGSTYTVTGIGEKAFSGCSSLTSITIPASVTSIGSDAFYKCSSLTSITIPASVTNIYSNAFWGCNLLTNIYITDMGSWCQTSGLNNLMPYGSSVKNLYLNNQLITNLVIPSGVTSIGSCSFQGCSLASITIPSSVTSIGSSAFSSCRSLTSITIPSRVTSIGNYAFEYCSSLTNITIPASVTSIGSHAFYNCSSLTNITIPSSVTSIGKYAFSDCRSLTTVAFAENSQCISIGSDAFYNCSSLTSITIPASVTSIGSSAFYNCSSLTIYCEASSAPSDWASGWNYSNYPVVWDCNNNEIASDGNIYTVVDGVRYALRDGDATVVRQSSRISGNVSIPSTVTHKGTIYSVIGIDERAFYDCSSLTSITIPESVTSIDSSAFFYCSSLTSITIPSGVTSIGSAAFYNCSSLTNITIPSSVTSIGNYAFYNCRLTSVIFEQTSGWWYSSSADATSGTSISSSDLANPATAATYLKSTYCSKYWKRS